MILGVYGYSKFGKTTLITELVQKLVAEGYNVATIKHIPYEDFTIDTEKKDTWLHANAGARLVVASAPNEVSFMVKNGMLLDQITRIVEEMLKPDLILVEGYKEENIEKIAVGDIEERANTVFRYDGDLKKILDYVRRNIDIERIHKQLPRVNCGKCGLDCAKMATLIYTGEKDFDDCSSFSQLNVVLEADDEEIPLGHFARDLIANVVNGMVSSLKGTDEARELRITLRR
ncbi:MAG: molybdopterin-guanine dinucleotide biosynthesis protein B [Methanocellales archaeon]|nr:molybdopterin-guanine dinucleotide biosynthesis protein B [Methanocellales archaeon]